MSEFEFVFTLFGLVLGLALAEVLGGFGRAIKAAGPPEDSGRKAVKIGWLTPMLALLVILDLGSFWSVSWQARDVIPPTLDYLLLGLLIFGLYYLAATLVFPDRPEDWGDLDRYFMRYKKWVLMGVVACNLLIHSALAAARAGEGYDGTTFFWLGLFSVILLAIAFLKNQRACRILLAIWVAIYVAYPILGLLGVAG